jgi:hypothetical protein
VILLIFGGLSGPPKISMSYFRQPLFSAGALLTAENSLFSAAMCQPPKVNGYFRWLL